MQQDDKEIILEKLESHDKRITKNTDDINDIKVNAAIQETTVKTLNKSMERLTDTINKGADKFDSYLLDSNKQSNSNGQGKVGIGVSIAMSIILLLLSFLHK